MQRKYFLKYIKNSEALFSQEKKNNFKLPKYNPNTHYKEISNSKYYKALLVFRNNIKLACDFYWSQIENAYNVDLFMLTSSVSSPIGLGSDSEVIKINFGNFETFLVDSSQFGFEPILLNGINKVYCYLPSMRGENPDKRHLNQFYHCEVEIKGDIKKLLFMMENFVKFLSEVSLNMPNLIYFLSKNPKLSIKYLKNIINSKKFYQIEFDEAVKLLEENGFKNYINYTTSGRDINNKGESELLKILKIKSPIWIKNFDRDRVAFYQKPHPNNLNKVINCDLLFPQIIKGSFCGEIIGSGQRQDNCKEMLESLNRQAINSGPYQWYIDIRKNKKYSITSGFGLGVERFITWLLCRDDIKDVIFYPRLKNIITYP